MSTPPDRHPAVPREATWLPDRDRWQVGAHDGDGRREGAFALYRPDDGSLYMRCRYVAGVEEGPFTVFHRDGTAAREGTYVAGEIDGRVVAHAPDGEASTEPLRSCCVPPGAVRLEARYDRGRILRELFLDQQGRVLLSDGTPRPAPPAGIPVDAGYDESAGRWFAPTDGADALEWTGLWRYYTGDGRLDEEIEYRAAQRQLARTFDHADGLVRTERRYSDGVRRHGAYLVRFVPGQSPYADARVVEERGSYDDDRLAGRVELRDDAGEIVRVVELGRPLGDDEALASPALADVDRPASAWWAEARVWREQGRTREALVAAARAAGRPDGGGAAALRAFLAETTCARRPDATPEGEGVGGESVAGLLTALVTGFDPAPILRQLASVAQPMPLLARDLVEAAVLLAPDSPLPRLTRALVRIDLGDDEGALADAAVVAAHSEEGAAFVRGYARVIFPSWTFWPAREPPTTDLPDMPESPDQPIEEIRRVVMMYATRLAALRAAIEARLPEGVRPTWLPPALSELLPDGPIPLRCESATIVDQTEDGPEETTVEVDERVRAGGTGVAALLRDARADWDALTWLCHCVGLDRVALPTEVSPAPGTLPRAFAETATRYIRAQDARLTGGMRARAAGVAGFSWEGTPVDDLPAPLADLCAGELLGRRAMLLWLSSRDNVSPFQSDLRGE